MNRVVFRLNGVLKINDYDIHCDSQLKGEEDNAVNGGVRRDSGLKGFLKTIIWPIYSLRNYLLVDGFIEEEAGRLIRRYLKEDTVFLEIGCGDMGLIRFLPRRICYNASDISFSEFQVKRILHKYRYELDRINLGIFSAVDMPLESESVSLLVAVEVLYYIKDINKAVSEIHRVLKPGGTFIVTLLNSHCHKYQKKGPHPGCANNWTFEGFKDYMQKHGFRYIEGYRKGYWISIPLWLTKTSYQLPISSKDDFYNTNLFFVFKK